MVSIFHFVPSLALNYVPIDTSRLIRNQATSALVRTGSSNNSNTEPTYTKQPIDKSNPLQTLIAWGEQSSCTVNQLGFQNRCRISKHEASAEAWVDRNSNCSTGLQISANLTGPPRGSVKFQATQGSSVIPLTSLGGNIETVSSWCSQFQLPVTFQIP